MIKILSLLILSLALTGCYETVNVKPDYLNRIMKLCDNYGGVKTIVLNQTVATVPPEAIAYCTNGVYIVTTGGVL